jgi:carboxypeptidase D
MRFSSYLPALAIGAGAVSAAQHSGRSLQHVGKKDLPVESQKRAPLPQIQQRSNSFQYLNNVTESKCSTALPQNLG